MDFIKLINDNWNASNAVKLGMLEDFAEYHSYQATVTNEQGEEIPNPQTMKDFANKVIIRFVKESVHAKRANKAREQATYTELELE